MKVIVVASFLAIAAQMKAGDFASAFAVVMVDAQTETKLGPLPYDRAVIAKAVDACARGGAKAVVLKFFFDQVRSARGDAALGDAMAKIPVALQARLESAEGTAQPIPEKFSLGRNRPTAAIRGDRGWIPLPGLLAHAAAVGFVDFAGPAIPLVEEYRGDSFKSLVLCCLELTVGVSARFEPEGRVQIGNGYLPVDASNVFLADLSRLEPLRVIPFDRLLAGEVKEGELKGRVVIIGADTANMPTVEIITGKMKTQMNIHRFFVQCVATGYRSLQANPSPAPAAK